MATRIVVEIYIKAARPVFVHDETGRGGAGAGRKEQEGRNE